VNARVPLRSCTLICFQKITDFNKIYIFRYIFLLMLVSVHNCYLIDDVVSDISDLFQICEGHVSMVISTLKYFLLLFLPQSVVRLHVLSSFSRTETNSFIFLTHYFIFLTSFHVWCQFSAFFSLCCFVHRVPLRNREGLIYMLM
jgi:ABC-type proline/glycine betaine transport system permease subunit